MSARNENARSWIKLERIPRVEGGEDGKRHRKICSVAHTILITSSFVAFFVASSVFCIFAVDYHSLVFL